METSQKQDLLSTQWKLPWWLLSTICMPLSIPFIFWKIFNYYKEKTNKKLLSSKVVLITGASSGLGESLAHVFYEAGCKVVLCARRRDELERVKSELLGLKTSGITHPPVVIPLDLSELKSIPEAVEKALEIFGHVDILINNGGISVRSDVLSSEMDVDIKVMLVNYFGSVALTKAILPSMIKRKEGRVVFISSVQGKFALPYRSAYSASKHAIQAFSDSLRAEVADSGIQVTCISPGYIRTELSVNALTGSGAPYGKTDPTTAAGYDARKMAKMILKAILLDEKDVILAQTTAHLAYWLRLISPGTYFWIMERRAKKLAIKED